VPVLALFFASVVSVSLVVGRVLHRQPAPQFTDMEFVPRLITCSSPSSANISSRPAVIGVRGTRGRLVALLPNAPYIFTDVIHLTRGSAHLSGWI
jgi:hypothetical protein